MRWHLKWKEASKWHFFCAVRKNGVAYYLFCKPQLILIAIIFFRDHKCNLIRNKMNQQYEYVINTCFNNKYQLIFLNDNDVNSFLNECKLWVYCQLVLRDSKKMHFLPLGAKVFRFPCDQAIVQLFNQDHAPILKEQFPFVVEKFSTCGCFSVNLKMQGMGGIPIVTPCVSPYSGQSKWFVKSHAVRIITYPISGHRRFSYFCRRQSHTRPKKPTTCWKGSTTIDSTFVRLVGNKVR